MDEFVAKAKQIITENIYCTIATASKESKPWISPVFFAVDENFSIFWISNKDSLHSRNIKDNSQVAIVIFNSQAPEGEGDAVYFEAKAEELLDEKSINNATTLLNDRITQEDFKVKNIKDVTNEGAWRIYKANPIQISKLSDGELVNGQYIDTRIEIKL